MQNRERPNTPSYNSSKSPKKVNYTYNVIEQFLHFICMCILKVLKFSAHGLRYYSKSEKNIKTFDIFGLARVLCKLIFSGRRGKICFFLMFC
jgi:hypothetical protein